MSDETSTSQHSSDKHGSSALDREAKRVENMTQSHERSQEDDQSERAKSGQTSHSEQDARVQTVTRQAKEAGAGSKESSEHLNKDG